MRGRKAGGRRRHMIFTWQGAEIEEVKEFNYLGYTLQRNNENGAHIKKLAKKAKVVLGKVWELAERNFRENWKKRMYLFDVLVESVLMYGVEIWGWKEHKEIEKIQDKYIKWTLKINTTTPRYILHAETKREKLSCKTGKKAINYKEKIIKKEGNELIKECIRVKHKETEYVKENNKKNNREKWKKTRNEFLEKKGWSLDYYYNYELSQEERQEHKWKK